MMHFLFTLMWIANGAFAAGPDDEARHFFRQHTFDGRELSHNLSNAGVALSLALPAWYVIKDPKKYGWTAAGSLALTGGLVLLSKASLPRTRPYQQECGGDPSYAEGCSSADSRKSFFSGHSAFAFTGAGLTCQFQKDQYLCGGALGLAAATGLLRISADKHYLTDVLTGGALGFLSGYFLNFTF